jgi:hypothetical protein
MVAELSWMVVAFGFGVDVMMDDEMEAPNELWNDCFSQCVRRTDGTAF